MRAAHPDVFLEKYFEHAVDDFLRYLRRLGTTGDGNHIGIFRRYELGCLSHLVHGSLLVTNRVDLPEEVFDVGQGLCELRGGLVGRAKNPVYPDRFNDALGDDAALENLQDGVDLTLVRLVDVDRFPLSRGRIECHGIRRFAALKETAKRLEILIDADGDELELRARKTRTQQRQLGRLLDTRWAPGGPKMYQDELPAQRAQIDERTLKRLAVQRNAAKPLLLEMVLSTSLAPFSVMERTSSPPPI